MKSLFAVLLLTFSFSALAGQGMGPGPGAKGYSGGGGMSVTALTKADNQGAGAVTVTTPGVSVTSGDCLAVLTMSYGTAVIDTVITNSGSAITWTKQISGAQGSDALQRCAIFTGVAAATASTTFTSTPAPAGSIFLAIGVVKINGCTTPTLDGTPGTNQNTGTSATVSLPATSTNGLVLANTGWNATATATAGAGYTLETTASYDNNTVEANTIISRVTTAGTYTPTVTLNASDQWVMCAMALKP